jgi:carbonic anhydrase
MQRLIEGVHCFPRETFGNSRELLNPPSHSGQQRPALLITCADAGLLAEQVSLNRPDGFLCATGLGTFIPPASTTDGDDSIVATIEYAVRVLQVGDIVVCGHSSCGAVGALMHGSLSGTSQPHLAWWLERVAPIQDLVRSRYAHLINAAEHQHVAELECVLLSLENLPTFPCVQEQLNCGALHLHGWFFKAATGELFAYEPATGQFEPLMAFGEGRRA